MTSIVLLSLLVLSCNCAVEFSSNARNFSIELMYFTHVEHFVMSPMSVWNVMAGAVEGSRGNSNKEIQRAAILPGNTTVFVKRFTKFSNTLFYSNPNGVELSSTTFLFQDNDIKILPSYKSAITRILDAHFRTYDFKDSLKTTNEANRVVQDIFPSISNVFHVDDFTEASLILSNVIHFRGILSTPFNASYTTEEVVYNEKNIAIGSVSMMRLKGKFKYSNFETMNSYILELPYGAGEKFCMLVIFPYPGVKPIDTYTKLDKTSLRDIFTKLETDFNNNELQEVEVKMPRFRIRTSMTLQTPLNDMGVFDVFEPNLARFEGISEDSIYIHSVDHKADIIFAEAETVVFSTTPGYFDHQPYSSNIKALQPFIFFIMEKTTASVLFGGIYSRHQNLNALDSRIFFQRD